MGYIVSWCWFITGPVMPFVSTALGIAFWLRVSRIVAPGLAGSKADQAIADNTFSIMANQFIGIFAVKLVFLLLGVAGVCPTFDTGAFLSDFWYYYVPDIGPSAAITFGVVYVAAGLVVPVLLHQLWVRAKGALSRVTSSK